MAASGLLHSVPEKGVSGTEYSFRTVGACFLHRMPLRMRRVPQEAFLSTARIFRTVEGPLRYRMLQAVKMRKGITWLGPAAQQAALCYSRYLPAFLYRMSVPDRALGTIKRKRSTVKVDLLWELRESNPRPSACKADALNQLS